MLTNLFRAEAAAKLEKTIERELLERLRQGAYGEAPLNVEYVVRWQSDTRVAVANPTLANQSGNEC